MTFTIPEFALNVTLQEDRYLQCVDGLTDMLERYYKVRSGPRHLASSQRHSYVKRLYSAETAMQWTLAYLLLL